MKKSLINNLLLTLVIMIGLTLSACKKEGAVEEAGEKLDQAVENVQEGESPFKEEGAGEKVGEAIDETIDEAQDAVQGENHE